MFCSTSTIERPSAFSCAMVRPTSCTICGARPSDGSSINSTRGLPISARPIASICCSPPESDPATCCSRSFSRGNSATTRSRFHGTGAPARDRPETIRFSRTVSVGKMRRPCGTKPTPLRAIASGTRRETGSPNKRISPRRGGRKPMMALMQVVFPAPLRPSSASTFPALSVNDTSCSTWLSP